MLGMKVDTVKRMLGVVVVTVVAVLGTSMPTNAHYQETITIRSCPQSLSQILNLSKTEEKFYGAK